MNERSIQFARSARRHRVGYGRARFVMENYVGQVSGDQYYWRGLDDRGLELEVLAIGKPDCLLVIHVMPMSFRRKRDEEGKDR